MKKLYIIAAIFLLTFTACMNKEVKPEKVSTAQTNGRPTWFFNPTMGKYTYGGIGVSGRSSKGISIQRKIAISRAIDELALQMGVSVKSIIQTNQTKNDSQYESYSVQTTTGDIFSARLMELWYDNAKEELYVWMVIE
jgi:hypothetical protein